MAMTCGRCCSNCILNVSAFLYLVIAVVIIAIAGSTFFTEYGQIIEPMYAGSFLGGGLAIFFISVVGFCAACGKEDEGSDKQGNRCSLWLFTLLTFCMLILTIACIAMMFQYENVLSLAAAAGMDSEALNSQAIEYEDLYGEYGTGVVETLMTNTVAACNATVTPTNLAASLFTFSCGNTYFNVFGSMVDNGCFEDSAINGSTGSYFDRCYEGELYSAWEVPASEKASAVGLAGALNTPKGLYCACSTTIISEYVLPYLDFAKYIAIVVVFFFFIVFCACIKQMCMRGCCKDKPKEGGSKDGPQWQQQGGSVQGDGWSGQGGVQMGYGGYDNVYDQKPANGKQPKKKAPKYNDDFLARP